MKKLRNYQGAVLFVLAAMVFAGCGGKSYYVSAAGSDANKGLSKKAAFKTLQKAVEAVAANPRINTITIAGSLTPSTEGDAGNEYNLFRVADTGAEEVTITGIENAMLSGTGSNKNLISFTGLTKVRLENIAFSGSGGIGLNVAEGATVTVGKGVTVSGSKSTGVYVHDTATFIMADGEISGNGGWQTGYGVNGSGGGIYINAGGTVLMSGGKITKNTANIEMGGGVYVSGTFTMSGGEITDNLVYSAGGGVCVPVGGTFTMSGGLISGNNADGMSGGGGVYVWIEEGSGNFTMNGGTITGNINGNVFGPFTKTGGEIEGEDFTLEQLTKAVIGRIDALNDGYNAAGLSLKKTGDSTYEGNVTHFAMPGPQLVTVTVGNGLDDLSVQISAAPAQGGGDWTLDELTEAVKQKIKADGGGYNTAELTLKKIGDNTYEGEVTHPDAHGSLYAIVRVRDGPRDFSVEFAY
ncbi:MAG: right-handed parallel beta-helix repeat-containing protein [Spirochaetaceae bacterium]|jgi:hypothetical protein|nr:right-handed parallel beta-helix repeat-containing protein [Spirochaetaceae bacterium]